MTTSENGRKFIESAEGVRLKAYQDSGGIWSIGVGHIEGVKEGDTCTFSQADQWLTEDLATAERCVNSRVKVPLNQNQFDALVSFVFNVGCGNFSHSTTLTALNEGEYAAAATALLMWDRVAGTVSAGLANRRAAEKALFQKAVNDAQTV